MRLFDRLMENKAENYHLKAYYGMDAQETKRYKDRMLRNTQGLI